MENTALDQAMEIVEKYIENSKADPSKEIEKVFSRIEKSFEVTEKNAEKIKAILMKSKLKNTKREAHISDADKFMLQGLLLKAGVRMSKKIREAVDFENGVIDFEQLLKVLKSKKSRDMRNKKEA